MPRLAIPPQGASYVDGSRRGVILDRDGVINVEVGYLSRIEDCAFVDGIFPLLTAFQAHGFRLTVATNQSGIGRGLFSEVAFAALMEGMLAALRRHGIAIDAVYYCPDHPTEGIGAYRRDNPWRKPGPGMMLQAIADFGLDPDRSWAIGDHERDMQAASGAGIRHRVLLAPGSEEVVRSDGVQIVGALASIEHLLDAS